MTWQSIHPQLKERNDEQLCYGLALACCESALQFTADQRIIDVASMLKQEPLDMNEINKHTYPVTLIRRNTDDLGAKEAAHIIIHVIGARNAIGIENKAAHAARCAEALSRVDESLSNEIVNRFLN